MFATLRFKQSGNPVSVFRICKISRRLWWVLKSRPYGFIQVVYLFTSSSVFSSPPVDVSVRVRTRLIVCFNT